MEHEHGTAYGLWSVVLIESAVFLFFALSFFRPRSTRDWRAFGGFAAFIVALFVEMYGFPLTIFLLSGWLARLGHKEERDMASKLGEEWNAYAARTPGWIPRLNRARAGTAKIGSSHA